jgi:ketosteroid isomerase-like protein
MLSREFAAKFATNWINAWNSHDLAQVLAHYSDDFEMSSPYIPRIAGELSGILKGKAAVGAYWAKALERMPELRFELVETLEGVDSVVLYYRSVGGMAAEVFFFDVRGKVIKAFAHYTQAP